MDIEKVNKQGGGIEYHLRTDEPINLREFSVALSQTTPNIDSELFQGRTTNHSHSGDGSPTRETSLAVLNRTLAISAGGSYSHDNALAYFVSSPVTDSGASPVESDDIWISDDTGCLTESEIEEAVYEVSRIIV